MIDIPPWAYVVAVPLFLFVLRQVLPSNPLRMLTHVNYLSGTLGTGKTGFFSDVASYVMRLPKSRRRLVRTGWRFSVVREETGWEVWSTFVLKGAKPLDCSLENWPRGPRKLIGIDELLLLTEEGMITWGAFSSGLALARQEGQVVVILSQEHRNERLKRRGWGTIGMFLQVRGLSFGRLGRLIVIRRAAEPFRREKKGYVADKTWTSLHWLKPRVFAAYNSKLIYGYTCDEFGQPLDRRVMVHQAEERRQQRQPKRFRQREKVMA